MSAGKPFLIVSTPNSGSDWLAECIQRATGWRYFRKEFFNPLTNGAYAETLLSAFGCELATGATNSPRSTWATTDFDARPFAWP